MMTRKRNIGRCSEAITEESKLGTNLFMVDPILVRVVCRVQTGHWRASAGSGGRDRWWPPEWKEWTAESRKQKGLSARSRVAGLGHTGASGEYRTLNGYCKVDKAESP